MVFRFYYISLRPRCNVKRLIYYIIIRLNFFESNNGRDCKIYDMKWTTIDFRDTKVTFMFIIIEVSNAIRLSNEAVNLYRYFYKLDCVFC